jgi:hypothetical protein
MLARQLLAPASRSTRLTPLFRRFNDTRFLKAEDNGQYNSGYEKYRKEVDPKLAGIDPNFVSASVSHHEHSKLMM